MPTLKESLTIGAIAIVALIVWNKFVLPLLPASVSKYVA